MSPTTASESGTYALYGAIEKNNPNVMRLLEIYANDEAYRIHSTSAAFQQYRAERLPYLAGLKILPVNGNGGSKIFFVKRVQKFPQASHAADSSRTKN